MRPYDTSCSAENVVTLRRLVVARWWWLGLSLLAIAAIAPGIGLTLPLYPLLAILAVLAAWNIQAAVQCRSGCIGNAQLFGQLAVDLTGLGVFLFFTGGATNPLVFLLLPPVAVGAMTLPAPFVLGTGFLAVTAYSILMVKFIPLHLPDPTRATELHLSGMWFTFVVSTAIIGGFIFRMTRSLRQKDAELAMAREQALRDERVLAMGAFAAGAAHELGTPLATLSILAEELEHATGLDAGTHADLQLMREQIAYCKRIITRLTQEAGAVRSEHVECKPCDVWLMQLYADWHALRGQPPAEFKVSGSGTVAPAIAAEPTLAQGLVNLLDNALRAGAPVLVSLHWDSREIQVQIRDHGPGFSPEVLDQAGHRPFPASPAGSGIGLMLTRAAIERLGGALILNNSNEGGAIAQIHLPLTRIANHD